ncbi:MAG: hypothetical protein KDB79_15130 [Acidobacteria bacterium]|nr:hypothetical protein [Acidobacteriota bacterium]
MKIQNKINVVLLLVLALFLTMACSEGEGSDTNASNKAEVSSTPTDGDQATNDADETDEDLPNEEPEADNGPTTVKFGGGKTSRTYNSSVDRGGSHTYYLSASAGQTMTIRIKSANQDAGFTVYSPSGSELSAGEETTEVREYNEELEDSGKYKIVVSSGRKVDYDITFAVSAKTRDLTPDEAAGGANKIVKFGRGNSSATYSNSVIRGESDTYILGAKAGQFMTVSVTSVENNAGFYIVAPNGENLVDDDDNWTGELPRDGNYQIVISSSRGNATYKVKFLIKQSPITD